jgi:2'-hydroxyisoflavone reductase
VRLLVLGGTVFVGRHVVSEALAREHEVSLFTRGRTNPELFPDAERLRGDRERGDLAALRGRAWDAVIDTSGYVPRVVSDSAGLLADRVERYAFVSSISVYADTSRPGVDEDAPVVALADPTTEQIVDAATYGGLKALCEDVVRRRFGGRALVVRPGLIAGPDDPTNRFTYWVARLARGGPVLAPEPRDQPVQLVDVRDLVAWTIDLLEHGVGGTFNATGPPEPLTMELFLQEVAEAVDGDGRLVWVGERFLVDAGVEPWSELPLWLAPTVDPSTAGLLAVDVTRAVAAGLRFRSLAETARDTLARAGGEGVAEAGTRASGPPAGLDPAKEAALLEKWGEAGTAAGG